MSDVPAEDELIGRAIGSYRVERQLGKGGMGAVYLGVHPVIGSKVAIKFLHPQYAHDEKIVERFYNEARAVNLIGHDNILKILDLNVTEDDRHYFVMEFLQGRALQELLRQNVGLPLAVTGPILLQCCDALEAAHQKGIIHRDLKPDNVYLISMKGKKNFVKVVDFGIARVTDGSGESAGKTQTGMVMGTPAYMSPEQASGQSSRIDGRSDVYSLGVMMYQMATGRLPFPGTNFGEVLIGHLQNAPPPPRKTNPAIPEAYEAIILKCLAKRKEDRFQSMAQLKTALEACMDALSISKELPRADEKAVVDATTVDARTPDPALRSTPGARTMTLRPGAQPRPAQQPPEASARTGLYLGLAASALGAVVAGGLLFVRSAREEGAVEPKAAAARAIKVAAAQPVPRPLAEAGPVFLSAISEPLEAQVTATWNEGEKKGQAPLSFEVPRNTRVHFEFDKPGYAGYAIDVIADQAQSVRAILSAVPGRPSAQDPGRKKQRHAKRAQPIKIDDDAARDGVIDVLNKLK